MDENLRKNKTVLGVDENVEALLTYVLGWVTGIAFLFLEKDNKFVRFHAMQSVATFLILFLASISLAYLPFIGALFSLIIGPISLVLWILLMVKAFQGQTFKLPLVGDFAEKQVGKPSL